MNLHYILSISLICSIVCLSHTSFALYTYDRCNETHCAENTYAGSDGTCHTCDNIEHVSLCRSKDCLNCPGYVPNRGKCVKKCPSDKPLMDTDGVCHSCNETKGINVEWVKENCTVCPNRWLNALGFCVLRHCPPEAPIQNFSGTCYRCDTPEPIPFYTDENNCAECPNRIFTQNMCMLPCPEDKPLIGEKGKCYACDTTEQYLENCQACPNRIKDKGECVLK